LGTYYRAGGAEMTDTTETDDLARGNHVVPTEFAEQLERERDEWKAKYLQQNKDLGHELLDPNGTIWSECKRLQTKLTAVTEQRDEAIRSCHIWQKGHAELVAERDYLLNLLQLNQPERKHTGRWGHNKKEFTSPYINQ